MLSSLSGRNLSQILLSNFYVKLPQQRNVFSFYTAADLRSRNYKNDTKAEGTKTNQTESWLWNDVLKNVNSKIKESNFTKVNSKPTDRKEIIRSARQILSRPYSGSSNDGKDDNDKEDNLEPIRKHLRYHYHKNVENAINKQIVHEFNAANTYLAMACYFGRTDVALLGMQKFYMTMFEEEIEHAMSFVKYQQIRGGHVKLTPVTVGECADGCSIKKSLEVSLLMETTVSDKIMDIIAIAEQHEDIRTQDFLITGFLSEQMQSIRNLGELLVRSIKLGESGLSEYLLDREMADASAHINKHK